MPKDCASSILLSLRQIIRSIDRHNKQLSGTHKLTVPQLVCLRQLLIGGPSPIGQLATAVCLSKATLTGIIDRLEGKGLVFRDRSLEDRRKVVLRLTEEGTRMAQNMPWPLQERFKVSLASMSQEEIELMDATLKKLLAMMEVPDLEVWPYGGEDAVPPDAEILPPAAEAVEPTTLQDMGNEHTKN